MGVVKGVICQLKELKSLEAKVEYGVNKVHRDLVDLVYAAGSYILQAVEFYVYGKQFASATKTADLRGRNYQAIADMLTQLLISLDRVDTLYQAFVKVEQKVLSKLDCARKSVVKEADQKKFVARGVGILGSMGLGVGAAALTALTAGAALPFIAGAALPLLAGAVAVGASGVVGAAGTVGAEGVALWFKHKYATIESVFKTLEEVVNGLEKALTAVRKEFAILHSQVQSVSDSVRDMKRINKSDACIVVTFEAFCERFAEIKDSDLDEVRKTVESSKLELQKAADSLFG